MNLTLVQRLRSEGVAIHLLGDLKTIEMFGPHGAMGGASERKRFFGLWSGEVMNELRAEHLAGRRIAQAILAEPVEPCDHVWEMLFGETYDKAVMCCNKCGGPA